MPEIPRTKFNSPWTVAVIEAALNDVSSAKGSSESLTAALNAMRAEINSLSGGVHLKGAVDYYSDLPASPSEGDAYTVRYQGTSGTDPLGIEYAWATYQGMPQWIPIGVDPSVFARQDEMNVVANAGAKNLLQFDSLPSGTTTYTTAGVKFDILSDGSVKAERVSASTSVANIALKIGGNNVYIDNFCNGKFILSGCPSGGGNSTYELMASITGGAYTKRDYGSGVLLTDKGSYSDIYVQCTVRSSFDGTVIFKPMIRPASITDPTFQPYARTNRELTVLTDEDRAALAELIDGGAKNLMKLGFTHKSAGSQTADMTADGNGIIVNGNRSTTTDTILAYDLVTNQSNMLDTRYTLPAGKYVIPSTGTSDLRYQVYCHDGTNYQSLGYTMINPLEFEYTLALKALYPYIAYRLWASRVSSFDNFTTYPMVCTKAAWDISQTFQPYRPSWQEMYERIVALESGGNRALTMQMQPTESTEAEEKEEG